MQIERRFSKVTLRAEQSGGKTYLSGYAALYYTLSEDLGGFRERLMPGAFARALEERQDVRHLINHDPSLLLGRTKAGTTELSEDGKGLRFRTRLPATGPADDLAELVSRGDIDECSFAFIALEQAWIDEKAADGSTQYIRELRDLNLIDVSVVTYPAYSGTSAGVGRSLFPEGIPMEVRSHLSKRAAAEKRNDSCECQCEECLAGNCADCSDPDCEDENCRAAVRQAFDRLTVACAAHGLDHAPADDGDRAIQRARQLAIAEQSW